MKLYKKSERLLKTAATLKSFRAIGFTTKHIGEYDRWKELENGRLQVKINVYEVVGNGMTCYFCSDTLGRVASAMITDLQEVMDWLKEHGYKTDKQWHIEDCGMSEELWNEWNEGM